MSAGTKKLLSAVSVAAGPLTNLIRVGGNAFVDFTTREDNTGGGVEVNLSTYTVIGGTLKSDGDYLMFWIDGEKFGALDTTFRITLDGITFTSWGGTTVGGWTAFFFIIRTGATTVKAVMMGFSMSNTPMSAYKTQTITLASDFIVKVTSQTVSTGPTPYSREYSMLCNFIRAG